MTTNQRCSYNCQSIGNQSPKRTEQLDDGWTAEQMNEGAMGTQIELTEAILLLKFYANKNLEKFCTALVLRLNTNIVHRNHKNIDRILSKLKNNICTTM